MWEDFSDDFLDNCWSLVALFATSFFDRDADDTFDSAEGLSVDTILASSEVA